jgi:hypothetical protein
MSSRAVTQKLYDSLVHAFRNCGADVSYSVVAKHCGCTIPTARKAYISGWTENVFAGVPALRPIGRLLEEVDGIPMHPPTVAKIERKRAATPAPVIPPPVLPASPPPPPLPAEIMPPMPEETSLRPGELEGYALRSTRQTLAALGVLRNAIHGAAAQTIPLTLTIQGSVKRLEASIRQRLEDSDMPIVERAALLKDLDALSKILAQSAAALKMVKEAENLSLGAPTSILGLIAPKAVASATSATSEAESRALLDWVMREGSQRQPEPVYMPESGGGCDDDPDDFGRTDA